jgi:hypothetical protein
MRAKEYSMKVLSSKSQLFIGLALGLAFLGVLGWFQLGKHGIVHTLIFRFDDVLLLCIGISFVLYGNASLQLTKIGHPGQNSDQSADDPSGQGSSRIESTLLNLLKLVPLSLDAIFGRKIVAVFKLLSGALFGVFALAALGETYFHGGFCNWSDCFLTSSTAFCFGLSFILHQPAWLHEQETSLPLAQSAAWAADDGNRATALVKLLACLVSLSSTIGWFVAALKHGTFNNWWGFACFAGVFLAFATSLLLYELRRVERCSYVAELK